MRKINKKSIVFFALVALIAMFTCVLVEPAMAAFHGDQHSTEMASDGHCVSACHMLHHQALTPDSATLLSSPVPNGLFRNYTDAFLLEEPVSSIFRPPLAV